MKPDIFGKTDIGSVRKNNEDAFGIDAALGLVVVADGMGGHNAGEVASDLAVQTILDLAHESGDPGSERGPRLKRFIEAANALIHEKSKLPQNLGMGTTVVTAWIGDQGMSVAHVGDSRLYLFHNGQLKQLTKDHSLVEEQLEKGLLTPERAAQADYKNILSRALGPDPAAAVDLSEYPLAPGDIVLLASDGLSKMVTDRDIERLVAEGGAISIIAENLIEKAKSAGGEDNITVALARIPSKDDLGYVQRIVSWFLGQGAR